MITVAFIGLGSRGNTYASCIARRDSMKIVACADIDGDKLARFGDKYGVPMDMRFDSADAILAQEKLADVCVIATPDRLHAAEALTAMDRGYHLLLEKPVSPVLSECVEVAKKANELNRHVVVCHVLRYTPFYGRLKQIISSGEIGDVVCVNAMESVQYWHQAHSFVRGNWRNKALSSPMILQKSCHAVVN